MDNAPAAPPPPAAAPVSAYPPPGAHAGQRPTGVTILAVLAAIGGAFAIIGGLIAIAAGTVGAALAGDAGGIIGLIAGALGVFLVLLGVVYLLAAYGLWTRKRWGWYMAMVAVVLGLLQALLTLFGEPVSGLIGLALNGFLLWYLLSPGVQAWFGLSHNTPWKYKAAA